MDGIAAIKNVACDDFGSQPGGFYRIGLSKTPAATCDNDHFVFKHIDTSALAGRFLAHFKLHADDCV